MIIDLVPGSNPILHSPLERFNFSDPQMDPVELAVNLAETMIHNKGLGLAANQIGVKYRVLAITGEPIRVMFNPIVVDFSPETVLAEEGCLTYPGLFVKVRRQAVVKVRYTQADGDVKTEEFAGLTARIIQHEIDHLDGITFHDRANPFHMEQAKRKQKQRLRKNK